MVCLVHMDPGLGSQGVGSLGASISIGCDGVWKADMINNEARIGTVASSNDKLLRALG